LALLEFAAAIAAADGPGLRGAAERVVVADAPSDWVEELILQSLLMVGWPRTLTAAGVWREVSGRPAPLDDDWAHYRHAGQWEVAGEVTCRLIYGLNYDRLRANVRALHPALDRWMVTEGYGRTLSRPGLEPRLRELCTVAQCAVQGAMPQLHSHLRGARNAGAAPGEVWAALHAALPWMSPADQVEARRLTALVAR
jgi:4-carboxymuconolactone decarboxylase